MNLITIKLYSQFKLVRKAWLSRRACYSVCELMPGQIKNTYLLSCCMFGNVQHVTFLEIPTELFSRKFPVHIVFPIVYFCLM